MHEPDRGSRQRVNGASVLVGVCAAVLLGGCGGRPRDDQPTTPTTQESDAARPGADSGRAPDRIDAQTASTDALTADAAARDAGHRADADTARDDGGTPDERAPAATPDGAAASPDARVPTVVPVVWIEVDGKAISNEPKIPGRLRVVEDHDGTLANAAMLGRLPATLESAIAIEIRGNSTATGVVAKKSYGIELRDGAGQDRALPVLGMPPESDWVLYGCWSDKTCLRNALTYDLVREFSAERWVPRVRFVEVFIDGKYQGLYNVVEKIKRDKARVPISKPAPTAAAGDLTGGYIWRREAEGKSPAARNWTTKAGTEYTFHYPKYDEITAEQRAYLLGFIERFEAAMNGPDWAHTERGYRAFVDMPSWIDSAVVQELTYHADSYKKSAYYYKQPDAVGGRIHAGPIWDFDLAYGNSQWNYRTDGWRWQQFLTAKPPHTAPFYWLKLWVDPPFTNEVRCRWKALRAGPLALVSINRKIDAYLKLIAAAEIRDHVRWPTIGQKIWPVHHVFATYAEEVAFLRKWLDERLRWMDANLPGTCP